ncbi:glutathione S-transferase [Pandoraea pulmonicola]|uniref:Glutathione S-transferase n=1 Tax=Pandoraea pulmonicola TaxID=93221 RepID=A0AAJ5CZ15_PANPU|nr:glutathione S-transferase [Pandoraea pulmonicola]AJC21920.1 glutathione S-transferase [Pandoraea pulmonicola]SUA89134.1 Glutathione S-transferase [Pandoraea pulmonicola]
MLKLYGFPISNYYNKVKVVLYEKGLPFEEVESIPCQDEPVLQCSPLGKVPYLQTEHGYLAESQVICDYLEAAHPTPALFSQDPWRQAKERELLTMLELHLELVVREVYTQAFFGGTVSEGTRSRTEKLLRRNIVAFKRLAKFSPYLAGETFTMADVAAGIHLPILGMATQAVYGEDFLQSASIDWKAYGKQLAERESFQRMRAEQKAYQQAQKAKAG